MLSQSQLDKYRAEYPVGATVELISMSDPQAPPYGTKGKITYVDDAGTIHVRWETGSGLGLVIGEDSFKIVKD